MSVLSIDLETFSDVDLIKCGVYAYTASDNFEILLMAYAFDADEVQIVDVASGEKIPDEIIAAIQDEAITKAAYNAQFERTTLSKHLGISLPPVGWQCTAVQAAMLGLPLSLAGVAQVLGLVEQKMREGKDLIRYFSIPCKSTATNKNRIRNLPHHEPEKWQTFKDYCMRDVEVERAIRKKIEKYPISPKEQEYYILDQQINDRGVLIDRKLVEKAMACDKLNKNEIFEQAQLLTGLVNPNSVAQLKEWLLENGVEVESLSKKVVTDLANESDGEVEQLLKLRLQLSKTSIKKYEAMDRVACPDDRVRGLFRFHGANRSGRWCLAEGTLVRVKTTLGLTIEKPIETVQLEDMVWDGDSWVDHDGVVFSGDKDVITWDGVTATQKHIVYISNTKKMTLEEAKRKELKLWRGNI